MENSHKCRSESMDKGFVFSSDAMFALIIGFIFITLIAYNPFEQKSPILKIEGQRQINDLLDLMDKRGTLRELDFEQIEKDMNNFLGKQYDWKIIISEYKQSQKSFTKTQTYLIGNTAKDLTQTETIKSNRIFLSFSGKNIEKYYVAECWVWLE